LSPALAGALVQARVLVEFEVLEEAGKARKYGNAFPGGQPRGRPLDAVFQTLNRY